MPGLSLRLRVTVSALVVFISFFFLATFLNHQAFAAVPKKDGGSGTSTDDTSKPCLPGNSLCTPEGGNSGGGTTKPKDSASGSSSEGTECTIPTSAFLGLPHWYEYLKGEKDGLGNCSPVIHKLEDVWLVVLAIGEILLRVAGILAVVYIIYGGFNFITSTGQPDKANNARSKIINALVGLAIVMVSASVVQFIGFRLGGNTNGNAFGLPQIGVGDGSDSVKTVLNVIFTIMGAVAALVIVIAGVIYVTSKGEPNNVNRARNTIAYAVVGLVVALSASVIVNFVVKA